MSYVHFTQSVVHDLLCQRLMFRQEEMSKLPLTFTARALCVLHLEHPVQWPTAEAFNSLARKHLTTVASKRMLATFAYLRKAHIKPQATDRGTAAACTSQRKLLRL